MCEYAKDDKVIKKTRKEHICSLCGWEIPKGSSCNYWEWVSDCQWNSWWVCLGCRGYVSRNDLGDCDGALAELVVIEDIRENYGYCSEDYLISHLGDYPYEESQIQYLVRLAIGDPS